jgi:hypothetical protein
VILSFDIREIRAHTIHVQSALLDKVTAAGVAKDASRAEESDVRLTEILHFLVRMAHAVSGLAMLGVSSRDTPGLISPSMLLLMGQIRLMVVELLSSLRRVRVCAMLPRMESSFLI